MDELILLILFATCFLIGFGVGFFLKWFFYSEKEVKLFKKLYAEKKDNMRLETEKRWLNEELEKSFTK